MAIEKTFIEKGVRSNKLEEFLEKSFKRAGYSHSNIRRTPARTRVIVYADKPGLVIGRGGRKINEITEKLKEKFDLENPQVDVQEIEKPELDANIVAEEIVNALEKGVNHRKIGNIMLKRIMESGAVGAEIRISGKLGSSRGRTEKFVDGYLKYCGNSAKELVDIKTKKAITPLGSLGVKVKIMEKYLKSPVEKIEEEKITEEKPEEEKEEKEKGFKCEVCGEIFDSKRGLNIHKGQKHKEDEK